MEVEDLAAGVVGCDSSSPAGPSSIPNPANARSAHRETRKTRAVDSPAQPSTKASKSSDPSEQMTTYHARQFIVDCRSAHDGENILQKLLSACGRAVSGGQSLEDLEETVLQACRDSQLRMTHISKLTKDQLLILCEASGHRADEMDDMKKSSIAEEYIDWLKQ